MIWVIMIVGAICIQTDWLSGPGELGPVAEWGKKFYQSDSITYNIAGQISPIATQINPQAWSTHIIDSDASIGYHSIWPADFDNDGDIDLAGWKGGNNLLQFYRNDNDTFKKVSSYAGPNVSALGFLYGADLNNDGFTDVVVPGGDSGGLKWYQNIGGFDFIPHLISSTSEYICVSGGDIDNDGDTDLVVTRGYLTPVEIWKNNGDGSFSLYQSLPCRGWRAAFGDLNGDGWTDLVIGDSYDCKFIVFLNYGGGDFHQAGTFANGYSNDALWIRDIDNDGDLDILCGLMRGNSHTLVNLSWMENSGDGVNYTQHNVWNGIYIYYGSGGFAEDVDLDGKVDVVSGYHSLAGFRQINPANFTIYQLDALGSYTHWLYPVQLGCGQCRQRANVDILACWDGSFVWYENKMVTEFASNSHLESSILESQWEMAQWKYSGYEACAPSDDALSFQFRTANTVEDIIVSDWSTPVYAPSGEMARDSIQLKLTVNDAKLFQYRINYKGAADAPVVYKVWVSYEHAAGVAEQKPKFKMKDVKLVFSADGKLILELPYEDRVRLEVYDVVGRLVKRIFYGKLDGTYEFEAPRKSGVYVAKLWYTGGVKTLKFTRLK